MGRQSRQKQALRAAGRRVEVGGQRRAPAAPASAPPRRARTADAELLGDLRLAAAKRREWDQHVESLIDRLVEGGAGWPAIAQALNVSRQAARQGYLRRTG